nr:transposase [Stutzerimonas kunmingensis]
MSRQRRTFPKAFKAQVIEECAQSGASVAGVALSHGLNANLVHKWIRKQREPLPVVSARFRCFSSASVWPRILVCRSRMARVCLTTSMLALRKPATSRCCSLRAFIWSRLALSCLASLPLPWVMALIGPRALSIRPSSTSSFKSRAMLRL